MSQPQKRLIRRPEVESKTGFKSTAIYDRIKRGEFPKPVSLGPNSVAWLESEIDNWIEDRIAGSRSTGK